MYVAAQDVATRDPGFAQPHEPPPFVPYVRGYDTINKTV